MVAILGYSREQIFSAVRGMYTAVANAPDSAFHFPVGRGACRALGYPPETTESLPAPLADSFAGVGYPFIADAVQPGDTVLDIGAGAGNDALIAGRRAGPEGHVVALDLTPAMAAKLRRVAVDAGVDNISVVQASAERLPFPDASVDAITSNGALNLVPDKRRAVNEMFRVLRPGGRLQLADVVIRRPVTVDCHSDPRLWVECVVGATVDEDLLDLFRDAGFEDVRVYRTQDYFSHSPSPQTRDIAAGFGAYSMELGMRRGGRKPSAIRRILCRINPRRLIMRLWRRGFMGVLGLTLALLACYGTLAAVGLLALLGVGLAVNDGFWAGSIAAFTALTALAVMPGIRLHRSVIPTVVAVLGAATIFYALFVHYTMLVEFVGFLLLTTGIGLDVRMRRREQSRILGLEAGGRKRQV